MSAYREPGAVEANYAPAGKLFAVLAGVALVAFAVAGPLAWCSVNKPPAPPRECVDSLQRLGDSITRECAPGAVGEVVMVKGAVADNVALKCTCSPPAPSGSVTP